jgi:hypothetical protein
LLVSLITSASAVMDVLFLDFSRLGIRIGRMAATKQNVRDVSSKYCQLNKGFNLQRLDRYGHEDQSWREVLVEDHHAGPAETAAARIDVSNWLDSMMSRDREIAGFLAAGNTTGETANRFDVTPGRISQKRREYLQSWQMLHGEDASARRTACVSA